MPGIDKERESNSKLAACTWSKEDDLKLLERIRPFIPKKDSLKFSKRAQQINWNKVMFNNFSAEDCIKRWNYVINQQRRFRMLSEILNDAFKWVKCDGKPANKEVTGQVFPNKPKSALVMFCLEKKAEVAEQNPGLKKQALRQKLTELYHKLDDTLKASYIEKAQNDRKEFLQKIEEFKKDHPDVPINASLLQEIESANLKNFGVPEKPLRPFNSFFKKLCADGTLRNSDKKKADRLWKELADDEKLKYEQEFEKLNLEYETKFAAYRLSAEKGIEAQPRKDVVEENDSLESVRAKEKLKAVVQLASKVNSAVQNPKVSDIINLIDSDRLESKQEGKKTTKTVKAAVLGSQSPKEESFKSEYTEAVASDGKAVKRSSPKAEPGVKPNKKNRKMV